MRASSCDRCLGGFHDRLLAGQYQFSRGPKRDETIFGGNPANGVSATGLGQYGHQFFT
jgi:hypothetical protein